jgi:hypothetical protein
MGAWFLCLTRLALLSFMMLAQCALTSIIVPFIELMFFLLVEGSMIVEHNSRILRKCKLIPIDLFESQ